MSWLERIHEHRVLGRRARVLAGVLAELAPPNARVLDVGSGDGRVAAALLERRPDLTIEGVDVLPRRDSQIPVRRYEGNSLPFDDGAFDAVMFVDVLHHCEDPVAVLAEGCRAAATHILLKDHLLQGVGAGLTLRFMDRVGNRRYGVSLPFNYLSRRQWTQAFARVGIEPVRTVTRLRLYPVPLDWVFGRGLHFAACLRKMPHSSPSHLGAPS